VHFFCEKNLTVHLSWKKKPTLHLCSKNKPDGASHLEKWGKKLSFVGKNSCASSSEKPCLKRIPVGASFKKILAVHLSWRCIF